MADNSTASPPTSPRRGNRSRGFRGNNTSSNPFPNSDRARGSDRGGRRGRGNRGARPRGNSRSGSNAAPLGPATETGQPPGLGGGGTFGDRLTEDATNTEGEERGKEQQQVGGAGDGEDVEAEVCFICASPVEHNSVAPCNHRTCHICALRLRALYKNKLCAHCRTEADYVIFTDDTSKRFEDFTDADFARKDNNLGIKYENLDIWEDTNLLLRYNCPDKDCDVACLSWLDLHRHVKTVHHKIMCDLCTRNKKVFTHEHELFTVAELRKHEKFGDDNPGAVDQSGFKGHPECGFCRQRFYGDDELFVHCREKHERCHICDRRNHGRSQQYYVDYNALEEHFRNDHFPCFDPECQEKKFVVFESQMDLKAHQLEAHPNDLSKDARRDARRVDMSGFDYRTPHQAPRGGGRREGRGVGRGRDPTTEPIPASSAQSLTRAELAYQRQMAVQSAQSITPRTFGGQLTQTVQAPPARISTPPLPPVSSLSLESTPPPANQTPQDQARQIAHAAVISRASALLNNNSQKLSSFRTQVSSYRSSSLTAAGLIDAFFALFDVPSSEMGKLIKELAEIYESDNKRNDLLRAWNDWRAINEDYPALPGQQLSSSTSSSISGGGKRVLRLKSSTAQSSRSAVSRQGSWGVSSANPITNPFPALPTPASTRGQIAQRTPWTNPNPPPSTLPQPPSHPLSAKPPNATIEAFPALPAAQRPNTLMAGLTRGSVKWNDQRSQVPATNAWGAATSGGPPASGTPAATVGLGDEDPVAGTAGGKKGKNKGKKQVLYSFG